MTNVDCGGLFTAVVKQVLDAALHPLGARRGPAAGPGCWVVLDEAANIASPDELDGLAATSASHGIQLVTVFQDLGPGHRPLRAPSLDGPQQPSGEDVPVGHGRRRNP